MSNTTTFSGSVSAVTTNNQYFQIEDVTKSAVSVDNQLANVNILHISQDNYNQLVASDAVLSNTLYIVSSDYVEAYGQQIKNVAEPTDLSDAATKEYVDNALTNVQIPTDLSAFTNSPGYTTNVGTITGITMNGASKGTSGNVNLGTVLTAHQSLSNCLQNNSSYNGINLTATSPCTFDFPHINLPDTSILFGNLDAESLYAYWHRVELKEKDAEGGYSSVKITTTPDIQIAYVAGNGPEPPKTPSELMSGIKFTGGTKNSPVTSSLADLIYTKNETSSATEISTAVNQKSAVSFNRITTSGTNIGSITIDGTTTQIYAPTGSGGGSSVQVSADYSTGTRVATISVDNVPTLIYVPNSSGGSSRYALETAQLVADSGSLTCAVNDQAITTIQVSSSSTPVVVQLPAQPEDGARDFILRIEISSSSAPTFTFSGVNETIDFDSEDDDWAVLEPGLNLVSFTETKRGDDSSTGNGGGGSNVVYHTVTFYVDSFAGSLTNPSDATRQVADGEAVGTLPTVMPRDGYYFHGWFTEQYGSGTYVTPSTIITADVTFYAYCSNSGGLAN